MILLGRTRSSLEAVNDEIRSTTSSDPLIVPLDLKTLDAKAAGDLYSGLAGSYSCIDGLLHNASILGPRLAIDEYPVSDWLEVMYVNVTAEFLLTQSLMPLLKSSNDGSVLFTSSGVGRKSRANWGAYAVSKFATEGLMQTLADELLATKIRVNSINPGGTRTKMRATAFPAEDPQSLPTPEEHMPLYLYLMGPDSAGVTGKAFDAYSWSLKS